MALVSINKNQVVTIPVPEVNVSKGVDKNRFAPLENKLEFLVAWGYCFCDNCNDNKPFKRTKSKVLCNTCSYIIAYIK